MKHGDYLQPRKHKTLHTRAFDSAAEYAAHATKHGDATRGASHHSSESFCKTETFADAQRMAERDGWPEGRERVEGLTGRLVAELSGRIMREDWTHDVEGAFVDVARFVEGEPECWLQQEEVYSEFGTSRRHVRILYNGTVSSGVPTSVIEARGAAICALVDLLELAGDVVSLEVIYCVCCGGDSEQVQVRFPVKSANERADLNKLCYWLAHPSALRRTTFAYFESLGDTLRKRFDFYNGKGYGHCQCNPEISADTFDVYFSQAYYGDAERVNWTDVNACKRWLETFLDSLGVRMSKATQ